MSDNCNKSGTEALAAATGSVAVGLEQMAEAMGLDLCEFGGSCDSCEAAPEAKTWVSMFISEGVCEASYYVCDKCLPQKYAEHVAMLEAIEEWPMDEPPNEEYLATSQA